VPSGEIDPNLVMLLSQEEREAPGQAGNGLHFSKLTVPRSFREARMSDQLEFWSKPMVDEKTPWILMNV
jgi:hypothetical protein